MKFFYLSVTVLFIFLLLIIAFENLFAKTTFFLLLFASVDAIPAFVTILIIAILGSIAGVFYTLFISELKKSSGNETDNDNS